MAYVLLAIGALMALVGIYAAATGYPIIQVEQGWATVISGATLIAGGAVTGALGLVLRTLLELKAATLRQAGAAVAGPGAQTSDTRVSGIKATDAEVSGHLVEPTAAPVASTARRLKRTAPAASPPAAPEPRATEAVEPPAHDSLEPAPATATPSVEPEPQPAPAVAEEHVAPIPPAAETVHAQSFDHHDEARDATATAFGHPDAAVSPAVAPLAEPPIAASTERVVEPPPPVETPETGAPAAQEPEPTETKPAKVQTKASVLPAEDDWLDRALAEIDRDQPAPPPPPRPAPPVKRQVVRIGSPLRRPAADVAPEPDPVLPPVPEPAFAESPAHAAAAHDEAPPAPNPAHTAPVATSAVIGRYEADGTSYVMYADGSIEAQSDAGVYRFASMTELKAFIES